MNTLRPTLLAAAVVAAVASTAMGLMTFRGETHEVDARQVCAAADWPLIPAECLQGAANRPVRVIGDRAADPAGAADFGRLAMRERFETAFQ
jgi:hypothetical protein